MAGVLRVFALTFAALALVACESSTEPGLSTDAGGRDAALGGDAAMGEDGAVDAGMVADSGVMVPDAGDLTEGEYDRDHLLRVEIELPTADWDALRSQSRTLATTLARPECLDVPFDSPYTWFSATVKIDGTEYSNVGVRKKGFLGSLSDVKPSLKVKLDEYQPGVEHLGVSSFTLNNAQQDPTLIKACISLDVFRAAGVPAGRCSFAEVFVNGTSLGVYVNVETIGKPFLRRWFTSDEGQLYEGTLSDFRQGWLGTFDQKTNEDIPYDRSDLEGLTAALESGDDGLFTALAPWLDLDAFNTFWATEVLVEHWDGYAGDTNNFYVYRDPGSGRFSFVPSGLDGVLGARDTGAPPSVLAVGLLARRLYLHPTGRALYLGELSRLVHEVWDATALVREVDRAAALIAPAVPAADRTRVAAATEQLRTFIRGRAATLQADLDAGGVDWTQPLRDPPCFIEANFDCELTTTFGTHPAPNIFASGTGTFTATVAGAPLRGVQVGASSGFGTSPDDMNDAVVALAATTATGDIPIVYVAIAPSLFTPGVIPIDGQIVRSALLRIPAGGNQIEFWGSVWSGWLEIRQASTTRGAAVNVAVHAGVLIPRTP